MPHAGSFFVPSNHIVVNLNGGKIVSKHIYLIKMLEKSKRWYLFEHVYIRKWFL